MCITINTFSIGVNDNSSYVTKTEFNLKMNSLETTILNLENSIDNRIANYINSLPMMFEAGGNISITKNITTAKWTIAYKASSYTITLNGYGAGDFTTSDVISAEWDPNQKQLTITTPTAVSTPIGSGTGMRTISFRTSEPLGGSQTAKATTATQAGLACTYTVYSDNTIWFRTTGSYTNTIGTQYTWNFNTCIILP
ncbi:MAG: hypothetical protein Q4G04_06745 [bacterium]|nr:hypothetical protein [bacterium]